MSGSNYRFSQVELPADAVAQLVGASVQGSNPSKCLILYLFCCVISAMLPRQSVGKSNFDSGLRNLIMLIIHIYINLHIYINFYVQFRFNIIKLCKLLYLCIHTHIHIVFKN